MLKTDDKGGSGEGARMDDAGQPEAWHMIT
jgi:hypothetical protein